MSTKTEEKKHSKYGGSNAARYVNCHGSVALEATIPKPESAGAAADEGTTAHKCLEKMLRGHYEEGKPVADIRRLAIRKFPVEMVEHCFKAFEHILATTPEHADVLIEEEVDASHFTMPGQFGGVDFAAVELYGRLTITDLKYGFGLVGAKDNLQLIYYALACSKKFEHDFAEIELKIIQPRAPDSNGNTIRSHVYKIEEILKYEKIFRHAVKQAEGPNPAFKVGDWCKWCRGKVICKTFKTKATADGALDFDEIPDPKTVQKEVIASNQLAKLLRAFPLMREYMKAVEAMAEATLANGGAVPGFKLADKLSNRNWLHGTEREARKRWGTAAFTMREPKLLPPAQMEKALLEHYDAKEVRKWVEKHTTREVTGKELVEDRGVEDFSTIEKKKGKRK